jgi:hypothetical protein
MFCICSSLGITFFSESMVYLFLFIPLNFKVLSNLQLLYMNDVLVCRSFANFTAQCFYNCTEIIIEIVEIYFSLSRTNST